MRFLSTGVALLLAGCCIFFAACSSAKSATASANTASLIDSQRYVFVAQTVTPLRGQMQQLNSGYSIRVTRDLVDCYLPYFGRAFSAPLNSEGGIKFKAGSFHHVVSAGKKKWDITIQPNGVPDVQAVYLTIFTNGTATVQVRTNNREAISYKGYIEGLNRN